MLVTMSLVFCLIGQPTKCLPPITPDQYDASSGLANCAIQGQILGAQYEEEHPKWFLARVRCTPGTPPRGDDI